MVVKINEEEILQRGLHAFAELGYDSSSVRELGQRIGASRNFINDRYGSKFAFWRAVVDFAISTINSTTEEEPTDPTLRLEHRMRTLFRSAAHNPELYRLLWDEAARDTERLDYLYEKYLKIAIRETLEGIEEDNPISKMPIHILYFALTGAITGLVQGPLAQKLGRPPVDLDDEDAIDGIADQLARIGLTEKPKTDSRPCTFNGVTPMKEEHDGQAG